MNTVVILGRTTSDIEVKKTQGGKSVARFTLAVNRKFDREKTDFIDVLAWEKTAENLAKYVQKGRQIAIQGSIQTGSYEKDGVKRKTFEVVVEQFDFCGDKGESKPAAKEEDPLLIDADEDMDDLPF